MLSLTDSFRKNKTILLRFYYSNLKGGIYYVGNDTITNLIGIVKICLLIQKYVGGLLH